MAKKKLKPHPTMPTVVPVTPKTKKSEHKMPPAPEWPVGTTIVEVRPMTEEEAEAEGWPLPRLPNMNSPTAVLVLSDGSELYASCDPEGNGPGCMFGVDDKGRSVRLA